MNFTLIVRESSAFDIMNKINIIIASKLKYIKIFLIITNYKIINS